MNYEQVDIALGFLEENSGIILQVPYARDIKLVSCYLKEKLTKEIKELRPDGIKLTDGRYVLIQTIGGGACGYGVGADRCFFVDRLNDRSYLDKLEVVESCV